MAVALASAATAFVAASLAAVSVKQCKKRHTEAIQVTYINQWCSIIKFGQIDCVW